MPELPEVEIAARNLRRWLVGRRIEAVDTSLVSKAARLVRPDDPATLGALAKRKVASVRRWGKHLLVELRGAPKLGVYSHLGMTGRWLRRLPEDAPPPHSRIRLHLEDASTLHYADARLFGRFRLVEGAHFETLPELADLGPDPMDAGIDVEVVAARLARTSRPVKVALMDQSVFAGVGNIQASEALFRAAIDPRRPSSSLARAEVKGIAEAVLASMADTIRAVSFDPERGDFQYVEDPGAENPFAMYGHAGEPCPRCRRGRVEKIVLGGRSTYFCSRCQK